MDLTVRDRTIEIALTPVERLWSCHISGSIQLPLFNLQAVSVSAEKPESRGRDLRAPGTYVPGLIKAGTYYSDLGRAFWYVSRNQPYLCLDLKVGYYKRVVLGSPLANEWCDQIQASLS